MARSKRSTRSPLKGLTQPVVIFNVHQNAEIAEAASGLGPTPAARYCPRERRVSARSCQGSPISSDAPESLTVRGV